MKPWGIMRMSLLILWMPGITSVTTSGGGITSVTTRSREYTTTAEITCPIKHQNGTECDGNFLCPEDHGCKDKRTCNCKEGFKKTADNECITINFCNAGTDSCGIHTTCVNIKRGFYCKCDYGYHKNNKTEFCPAYNKTKDSCTAINHCVDGSDSCGNYTTCKHKVQGSYCICDEGYHKGNKREFVSSYNKPKESCTDIDECKNNSICGPNSICTNIPGSYQCDCMTGYINITGKCEVKCKNPTESEPCNDKPFVCSLKKFIDSYTPKCGSNSSEWSNFVMRMFDRLDELIARLEYRSDRERLQNVGDLLMKVERTVQNLARLVPSNNVHFNNRKTIGISTVRRSQKTGQLLLRVTNSSVTLNSSRDDDDTLLGCLEYSNIPRLMEGAKLLDSGYSEDLAFQVVSPVISVFLGGSNVTLHQPIFLHLNFTGTEKVNVSRAHCVFWSTNDSAWSTEGCTKVQSDEYGIQCRCTHLTSFAILMALNPIESWPLTLITKIGLSLSILCLALSIITFCLYRPLRGTRTTIHTHLCITLFMANCIFLLGITATSNEVVCGIVAGLLHAFYLSSFCWMALEGLELYLMLVTVFKTHLKKRYLMLMGYGVPVVIVIISASVNHAGYGTKKYCWLSLEKNFIWSFMGPVCVIILVTCAIFVLTVWKLAEKMTSINPEQGRLKRIRTLTVTAVAQLCILGCCWIFGFFMFGSSKLYFAYLFTILNTLQGVQIFLLHCLMKRKIREEYWRWMRAIAQMKPVTYSEFSETNTQSKTKTTNNESGL